jgi:hypothetical protein
MPLVDIDAHNKSYEDAIPRGQMPPSAPPPSEASGFSSALRICGFVDLVAGVIGAMVIWANAPSSYAGNSGFYAVLATATAFQGVLFCVLFNVIAEMSETLRAILYKLSEKSDRA